MKQFAKFLTAVMLAAGLLAISGCEKSEQPAAQAEQNQTVQAQHVKLAVDGMTCGSCAKSIESGSINPLRQIRFLQQHYSPPLLKKPWYDIQGFIFQFINPKRRR